MILFGSPTATLELCFISATPLFSSHYRKHVSLATKEKDLKKVYFNTKHDLFVTTTE